MAAPSYVPTDTFPEPRVYASPPRRDGSWMADRPGDIDGRQPAADQLGNQGPDQGYALKLAADLEPELRLTEGEHGSDALAGGGAVALKRASLYGRAPCIHDVRVGLGIFGFFDDSPPPDLVDARRIWFEEVHNPHAYTSLQRLVDRVPAESLKAPHEEILAAASSDWRSVIDAD